MRIGRVESQSSPWKTAEGTSSCCCAVMGQARTPRIVGFRTAYTAASLRRSKLELAELIAKVPSIQAVRDMNDRILILGGGLAH